MQSIGQRKLSESQRQLKQAQREQAKQHATAVKHDTHTIEKGLGYKPYRIIGGEHKSSHRTLYQKKMLRGDDSALGTDVKPVSILARQQKASGYYTGKA